MSRPAGSHASGTADTGWPALPTVSGPSALDWLAEVQPVPLHRARIVFARKRTWAYMTDKDQAYRDELRLLWKAARLKPLKGDLIVAMTFQGRGRKPDLSNLIKAVEDAGNTFLWNDDAQIIELHAAISAWGPKQTPLVSIRAWQVSS